MQPDPNFSRAEVLVLSDHLEAIYATTTFGGLMQRSIELLQPFFSADYFGVGLNDPNRRCVISIGAPTTVPYRQYAEAARAVAHESPLFQYWLKTRDHDRVLRRTDCCDESAFRNTALYGAVGRPLRLTRQIGTWLRPGNGHHLEIGMYRGGRVDFSQRDVARLALLRVHVRRAYLNLMDRHELLRRRNQPIDAGQLPEGAFEEHFTSMSAGLDPEPADAPRVGGGGLAMLTPREAEILGWIIEGKTNPEIATILGTSWRTVRTQVERILRKLNVETRTAAAMRAVEHGGWKTRR